MIDYGNDRHEILKKYFGYDKFREGQEDLINEILKGNDVIGIMPTGGGKSLCYQIPAMMMPGITIVVSPLISLMNDQVQALVQLGIRGAYLNSSLSYKQIRLFFERALAGTYKIIYVSPERLETQEFLDFIDSVRISMVTVDEAHCISQWGQDFRPGYLKIADFINRFDNRPVVSAFTATATDHVREDIVHKLELKSPYTKITGFDRKNLYFGIERMSEAEKYGYLRKYVSEHKSDNGIVYCATRKNVNEVYERLKSEGFSAGRYHAGMTDVERNESQMDFIFDRCSVMVATNAFGMGIDKSNVRYVIHYNMPQNLESYYQEAGRAGRDGEAAECILLYAGTDVRLNQFLIEHSEENPDLSMEDRIAVRRNNLEKLKKMTFYSTNNRCLRMNILRYFGEPSAEYCSNCSNCKGNFIEKDMTEQAIKVIKCMIEEKEMYGIGMVSGILAGSSEDKIIDRGCDEYMTYGSLSNMSRKEIQDMIQAMISEGYIKTTDDQYRVLKLNKTSFSVLDGDVKATIRMPDEVKTRLINIIKPAKKTASGILGKDLSEEGRALYEELKKLRAFLASLEGIPGYMVFSDKVLLDMCIKRPKSKSEMLKIDGMGHRKYENYGYRFLYAIETFKYNKQK